MFEKAAEFGNSNALSCLAICYFQGKGVEKNYADAVEYCKKAASLGNCISMRYLGDCYENGNGVEKNYSKAIEYYEKAIELGNEEAKNKLKILKEKLNT